MTTQTMNENELITLAKNIHLNINKAEAEEFIALMMPGIDTYHLISELEDEIPEVSYQRETGHEPAAEDNPLNAWAWIANISGAETGSLRGRTVAIKDNIAVAGMPMVNGSMTLKGFVPRFDATVVSRLLEAGATIKGKATCEQFCLSGGSHTSQPNAVHNPNKPGYSAGGSSSGSAALVASGQVDMAVGSDQGGSVRIPAAFCGAYGMKPTHGLVPYTGAMPIEATVDHLGPITSNVRDNALMLEVIAGYDGLDPRQFNPQTHTYTEALNKGVKGLKIGVLAEGFELSNLDVDVKNTVLKAIDIFEKLGAEITNVSIPEHALAAALWTPIGCEGLLTQMMLSNGMGHNWKGLYDSELTSKHSEWRQYSDELSPSLKLCMLLGEYGRTKYNGQLYGKAQNIARRAKKAYDDALENVDLLIMPTVPITAQPLPDENVSITESVARALEMIGNTSPQDVTGHPAMSIPCGVLDELPVGLMLVGKYYDECTIYQAASAFEQSNDWRTL